MGQEFVIVAAGCDKDAGKAATDKTNYLQKLRSSRAISEGSPDVYGPWALDVPDGDRALQFGSFDQLIKLTDDLAKSDSQVDSLLHRLERQFLEIDETAEFKVKQLRAERSIIDYLKAWQWDEAKYPRNRSIADTLVFLTSVVAKLDDESRNRTSQYNEYKVQKNNLARKDNVSLHSRELIDVFTHDVVTMQGGSDDDFIYSEYLTTVVVIVPKNSERDFLKSYEFIRDVDGNEIKEGVVPMSAKKFTGPNFEDSESALWRVVVFKKAVELFKTSCKEQRVIPRDFEYSIQSCKRLAEQRAKVNQLVDSTFQNLRILYKAAWSDVFIAWMHIKAMRIFVESVLRFGMPPSFASFICATKNGATAGLRKDLGTILGKESGSQQVKLAAAGEDDEEYFSYVSLSFTPLACAR